MEVPLLLLWRWRAAGCCTYEGFLFSHSPKTPVYVPGARRRTVPTVSSFLNTALRATDASAHAEIWPHCRQRIACGLHDY